MRSWAPLPIDRTRNARVAPRNASSGSVGVYPARTSQRQSFRIGASPRTVTPNISARSLPSNSARNGIDAVPPDFRGDLSSDELRSLQFGARRTIWMLRMFFLWPGARANVLPAFL